MMPLHDECIGMCLAQADHIDYYRFKECNQKCELIRCPNFILCNNSLPQCILDCHAGRCLNCNMFFGKTLRIVEFDDECCICLDEKSYAVVWGCSHKICVDCFKQKQGLNNRKDIRESRIISYEEKVERDIKSNEYESLHPAADEISDEEQYIEVGENLKICPICRHKEVPDWKKDRTEVKDK